MIKNNIFLTGSIGIGKSTIIRKVINQLSLHVCGFSVDREGKKNNWNAFYLVEASSFNNGDRSKKSKYNRFAFRNDYSTNWEINIQVFNEIGVKLLTNIDNADIVIMDELGRFELTAYQFQQKVYEVLNSDKPVLGVIKDESNPFLDKIRNRKDVQIFRVLPDNREEVYKKVLSQIKLILSIKE
ncbi:AAA ATPase [Petrotoga mobilis SJ95]|jgi:nucleoside-triphosphatase|uniref:AAA ATPase n=1 Tax=Petrotoga mobilis (strain DSM 10674 / SJ95) TaxID=403833 RepID=A9BIU7_PETMO|nr:ATPase AAA [Petrotoga mobilis]ABX32435.1 AAA ATPase [Petrotoga mobilis SJ95]MDK2812038.1 nucleoside-triphosphatase [Petrotoga sp.]